MRNSLKRQNKEYIPLPSPMPSKSQPPKMNISEWNGTRLYRMLGEYLTCQYNANTDKDIFREASLKVILDRHISHRETLREICSHTGQYVKDFIASAKRLIDIKAKEDPTTAAQWEVELKSLLNIFVKEQPGWIQQGYKTAFENQQKKVGKRKAADLEESDLQVIPSSSTLSHLSKPIPDSISCSNQGAPTTTWDQQLQGQLEGQRQGERQRQRDSQSQDLQLDSNLVQKRSKNRRKSSKAVRAEKMFRMKVMSQTCEEKLENKIHNISGVEITDEELSSLQCGINFIPRPKPNKKQLKESMDKFTKTVRLKWIYKDEDNIVPKWHIPSSWIPRAHLSHEEIENALRDLYKSLSNAPKQKVKNNWTQCQNNALKRLLNRPDILVITADKNLGYVICSIEWYQKAILEHLSDKSTYEEVTDLFNGKDKGATFMRDLGSRVEKMTLQYRKALSKEEIRWMCQKRTWCPMKFYLLAKVHKNPIKGRPIAPSMTWVTHNLSQWLSAQLNPLMEKIDLVLRDTTAFINSVRKINKVKVLHGQDVWLIGLDVQALYPSMDTVTGLELTKEFLIGYSGYPIALQNLIVEAMHLVLTNGYLQCNDKIYRQINGAAMGSPFVPPYANIFMYMLEKSTVHNWIRSKKLVFYKRFLDDIFAIICGSKDDALLFQEELNLIKPDMIKLTGDISQSQIVFLDTTLIWDQHRQVLTTQVYQKPMNRYQYLPWESYHTKGMKGGFIKGEAIRYARISSNQADFNGIIAKFKQRLKNRGYPLSFILKHLECVVWGKRKEYLVYKPKSDKLPLLFPVKYNPFINKSHLREALDQFTKKMLGWKEVPTSLKEKVTICHSLEHKLHKRILSSRKSKGF